MRTIATTTLAAAVLLAIVPAAHATTNTMVTVVGTGTAGATGDTGPGLQATLSYPRQIALLGDGSLLIADSGNHRIRKLTPSGVVTTVAGTGTAGSTGDNGAADAAQLNSPFDVEVAADGASYYIVEAVGNRVRRVDASGVVTTVAGTGTTGGGGDYGAANAAQLASPTGIGLAANGDLYIADTQNHRIRLVQAGGDGVATGSDPIFTVAGTGVAGAGGDTGAAITATFYQPSDVLPLADGSYVIADASNGRIRQVDPFGTVRLVVTGSCNGTTWRCGDGGPVSLAQAMRPQALESDGAGGYYFADQTAHRVRRVSASGIITAVAGSGTACTPSTSRCGDGAAAEAAQLNNPSGVALAGDGTVFVSDSSDHRIRARIADPNTAPPGPQGPQGPQGPAGGSGAGGASGPDGSAGAVGTPGATGADGTTGRNGAPGASGRPSSFVVPLVVVLPSDRVRPSGQSSRRRLAMFVSRPCTVTVTLKRRGRRASKVKVAISKPGRISVNLGGVKRGTYAVAVRATADKSTATDRATLVVR